MTIHLKYQTGELFACIGLQGGMVCTRATRAGLLGKAKSQDCARRLPWSSALATQLYAMLIEQIEEGLPASPACRAAYRTRAAAPASIPGWLPAALTERRQMWQSRAPLQACLAAGPSLMASCRRSARREHQTSASEPAHAESLRTLRVCILAELRIQKHPVHSSPTDKGSAGAVKPYLGLCGGSAWGPASRWCSLCLVRLAQQFGRNAEDKLLLLRQRPHCLHYCRCLSSACTDRQHKCNL